MESTYQWKESDKTITYLSGETVVFEDTLDHWNNGVRRLLHLSPEAAKQWVETSVAMGSAQGKSFDQLTTGERVAAIKAAWAKLYPYSVVVMDEQLVGKARQSVCGHKADKVFANNIGPDTEYALVGCSQCQHAWLVDAKDPGKELSDLVSYEEDYFEGGKKGLGYGNYLDQEQWRLEKAHRLLRQVKAAALWLGKSLDKDTSVLDVGSGYGFFRKAVDEEGWAHDGIEASKYATEVCEEQYGFKTFVGNLRDFYNANPTKQYDILILADVIEHVYDPVEEFRLMKKMLKPGGLCIVRTPSNASLEQEIFGNLFYSLKKEHFNLFSPRSVSLLSHKAGLSPRLVVTQSHLLSGFIQEGIRVYETTQAGSDIFAIIQNS